MSEPVPQVSPGPVDDLRALLAAVYGPVRAQSVGVGMVSLALPLYLRDSGLSFTTTSVVLAATGVGAFAGAIPSGVFTARFGERRALVSALVAMALCMALTGLTEHPAPLLALQFAVGAGATAIRLAAQTTITRGVPTGLRGRSMSGIGGIHRLGVFVGPIVAGLMIDTFGFTEAFLLAAVVTLSGIAAARRARARVEAVATSSGPALPAHEEPQASMRVAMRGHWKRVVVFGIGPLLIMTARSGRRVVLPLIATALDISPAAVGVVVAVGTGADLLLFPVAGWVMDRFGRLFAIGPAFLLMAAGLFLLGTADSSLTVVVAGAVIGIGNGLSAGSILTIGSDLAPASAPSQFLAAFSAMADLGQIVGPLVVGLLADALGLGWAATGLAMILVVGLCWMVATIGETHQPAAASAER